MPSRKLATLFSAAAAAAVLLGGCAESNAPSDGERIYDDNGGPTVDDGTLVLPDDDLMRFEVQLELYSDAGACSTTLEPTGLELTPPTAEGEMTVIVHAEVEPTFESGQLIC
jgi:hypothetical protein